MRDTNMLCSARVSTPTFFQSMATQMRGGLCQLSETLRFARRRRCIANGVSAQRRPFESMCSNIGEPMCCTFGELRCLTSASRCALTSASRSVLTSASRCVLTSASRGVLTSASRCVHGHRSAASASHCSEVLLAPNPVQQAQGLVISEPTLAKPAVAMPTVMPKERQVLNVEREVRLHIVEQSVQQLGASD